MLITTSGMAAQLEDFLAVHPRQSKVQRNDVGTPGPGLGQPPAPRPENDPDRRGRERPSAA
jgi:hypothetical protein